MAFSRTRKSWKKAASPGKFWKSMKFMVDRKENEHRDLGSERVNVNFRALEKSI